MGTIVTTTWNRDCSQFSSVVSGRILHKCSLKGRKLALDIAFNEVGPLGNVIPWKQYQLNEMVKWISTYQS